jgi:6-phosphogluconolactonase (cycloisomerase 2 family)
VVALNITPDPLYIQIGKTQQLKAMAVYADGTQQDVSQQVTWSSSNNTIASVSNAGLVSMQDLGKVTISVKLAGIQASVNGTGTPHYLYVVNNENGGSVTTYPLNKDGSINGNGTTQTLGYAPNFININPAGTKAYITTVNDDFQNEIYSYNISPVDGSLTLIQAQPLLSQILAGDALVFNPVYGTAFTRGIDEDSEDSDNTFGQYNFAANNGLIETANPASYSAPNLGRYMAFDASGKHLYAANQVDGSQSSVVVYNINSKGLITAPTLPLVPVGTGGDDYPEGITLDNTGRYCYISMVNSARIVVYSISQASGGLIKNSEVTNTVTNPGPMAIDPSNRFLYVFRELGTYIGVYTINSDGSLAPALVPSIDLDVLDKMQFNPTQTDYVYLVSNSTSEVFTYKVNNDASLTLMNTLPTGIKPIDFVVN